MLFSLFNKKETQTAQVYNLDALGEINSPRVNLAFLKRSVDEDIGLFSRLLIEQNFKGIDEVVTKATVKTIVSEKLDATQLHLFGKSLLADDITELSCLFMDIIKEDLVHLYLKVVPNDACSKFHTDLYDLRLLCTYVGKGTEWVEEQYVNRKMLMKGENHQIIKDATKVQTMQPFEVGILKGEASPTNKNRGIVHRSPPILQTGEKRLLLRLDF